MTTLLFHLLIAVLNFSLLTITRIGARSVLSLSDDHMYRKWLCGAHDMSREVSLQTNTNSK